MLSDKTIQIIEEIAPLVAVAVHAEIITPNLDV